MNTPITKDQIMQQVILLQHARKEIIGAMNTLRDFGRKNPDPYTGQDLISPLQAHVGKIDRRIEDLKTAWLEMDSLHSPQAE